MPSFCEIFDRLVDDELEVDLVADEAVDFLVVVAVYFDFEVELFDVFLFELQAQQISANAIMNSDFGMACNCRPNISVNLRAKLRERWIKIHPNA